MERPHPPCQTQLLADLRAGEAAAYEALYAQAYPAIARLVRQNRGQDDDAQDLFQEAMLVLHQKMARPNFQLAASLHTFLYAIARNLWLKKLRDETWITTDDAERLAALHDQQAWQTPEPAEPERETAVHTWLTHITDHCQQVLQSLYFQEQPMEELMHTMGWKNKHTASNQKYKCIQQIRKVAER